MNQAGRNPIFISDDTGNREWRGPKESGHPTFSKIDAHRHTHQFRHELRKEKQTDEKAGNRSPPRDSRNADSPGQNYTQTQIRNGFSHPPYHDWFWLSHSVGNVGAGMCGNAQDMSQKEDLQHMA